MPKRNLVVPVSNEEWTEFTRQASKQKISVGAFIRQKLGLPEINTNGGKPFRRKYKTIVQKEYDGKD